MSEKSMRKTVITLLKQLDARPVENRVGIGMPDVNYVEGWIELKELKEWPVQNGTVHVPHYTQDQRLWALRRRRSLGKCWLLLKVKQEWLLMQGDVAAEVLGRVPRSQLIYRSWRYWPKGIDRLSLISALYSKQQMAYE